MLNVTIEIAELYRHGTAIIEEPDGVTLIIDEHADEVPKHYAIDHALPRAVRRWTRAQLVEMHQLEPEELDEE